MKALSIRQPWGWAIFNAGKNIENRSRYYKYRGKLLIHSSKKIDPYGYEYLRSIGIIPPDNIPMGGIIGVVSIIGCVDKHSSKWFFGPHGLILKDPIQFTFIPMLGKLGFFEVDERIFI